jgi:hypothetical protein
MHSLFILVSIKEYQEGTKKIYENKITNLMAVLTLIDK